MVAGGETVKPDPEAPVTNPMLEVRRGSRLAACMWKKRPAKQRPSGEQPSQIGVLGAGRVLVGIRMDHDVLPCTDVVGWPSFGFGCQQCKQTKAGQTATEVRITDRTGLDRVHAPTNSPRVRVS